MIESPLKFEKKFQKLKSDCAALSAPDVKLLLLIDFWPELKEYREKPAYQSYFDEYLPNVYELITENNLTDLSIEELQRLRDTISEKPTRSGYPGSSTGIVTTALAKKLFYIGEAERALAILGLRFSLPDDIDPLTEFEILQSIYEKSQSENPGLAELLRPILIEWQSEIESVTPALVVSV